MRTVTSLIAAAAILVVGSAAPAAAQSCAGDCNGDAAVAINELIVGINIVLGQSEAGTCPALDADGNTLVDISELTRAVVSASQGCRPTARIVGRCSRPGPGPMGRVPCDSGTTITASPCDDRRTCLREPARRRVGVTQVETEGQWTMLIDAVDLTADLLFEADIDGATAYRRIDIGSGFIPGARLLGGTTERMVDISPSSEATARVLELNGLENFTDEGVAAVGEAVDAATALIDFGVLEGSGYSAADGADLATLTAVRDPEVIDAVEDGSFEPGTLPTRTPTATASASPTPTSTPLRRFAFVANLLSDSVSVIDTNNDEVVDTIGVGKAPAGLALSPNGRLAIVVNSDDETLSVIDTAARQVVGTVPDVDTDLVTNPLVAAIDASGQLAYVSHNQSEVVEVIDLALAVSDPANAHIDTIAVGAAPLGIALARNRPLALVANVESHTVSVVDTDTRAIVATVPLADTQPAFVGLSSDDATAYVSGESAGAEGTLSVIDVELAINQAGAAAVVDTKTIGLRPTGLAVSRNDALVAVVNTLSSSVSLVAGDTVRHVPLLGASAPQAIALTADGQRAYVTNCELNSVTVLDLALANSDPLNAVIKTIPVGGCPQGIAIAENLPPP